MNTLLVWRIAACLGSLGCASPASIVLVQSSGEVVIAADAKRVLAPAISIQACKIEKRGRCYFAVAGSAFRLNTGFDARDFAGAACGQAGRIAEKPALLQKLVWESIAAALRCLQATKLDLYRQSLRTKIVEVVFAGQEDRSVAASLATFFLSADGALMMFSQDLSATPQLPHKRFFTLGIAGDRFHVPPALPASGGSILEDNLSAQEFAKGYIDAVIERAGGALSPPVAVLKIDQSGPHWIEPGLCRNAE